MGARAARGRLWSPCRPTLADLPHTLSHYLCWTESKTESRWKHWAEDRGFNIKDNPCFLATFLDTIQYGILQYSWGRFSAQFWSFRVHTRILFNPFSSPENPIGLVPWSPGRGRPPQLCLALGEGGGWPPRSNPRAVSYFCFLPFSSGAERS